ncbi:MAG TPA: FGGY family carbohydrate kinase [Frankiaceae bacterium]|nr:FGGY family carbohydrate kinase [Frankiaceae bacterium]
MIFLTVTIGSTVRAEAWSSDGVRGSCQMGYEVSPRAWWSAVESTVGTLAIDRAEVVAIGCAGDPSPQVLLARDGEPLEVVPAGMSLAPYRRVGWVVSARDFVASLMTGRLATDPTMASAAGFFGPDGHLLPDAVAAADADPAWLPPQRGSTEVLGDLLLPAARRLGLVSRIPVVTGATSFACTVEGIGALPVAPLVTPVPAGFRVAVPVEPPAPAPPPGVTLVAGGRSYQVYDATVASAVDVATLVRQLAPDAKFLYAGAPSDRRWPVEVATLTGLPVAHRRWTTPDVGLAMLVATGAGQHLDRDVINEVSYVDEPRLA